MKDANFDEEHRDFDSLFSMASPIGFFMIILLCRVRMICLFTLGVLVVIAFSFFFFDTCMISSLENRIIGDEFNIIDPVLELFNMDLNFMNRLKISYGIGCFYIVAMFCLYFVRFHRKDVAEIIKKYKGGFKRDVASEPVASQPVASEPVASEPVASEPVASQPVASEPVASQPVASQPVASQPVAEETMR